MSHFLTTVQANDPSAFMHSLPLYLLPSALDRTPQPLRTPWHHSPSYVKFLIRHLGGLKSMLVP